MSEREPQQPSASAPSGQEQVNDDLWAHGDGARLVRAYDNRQLRPVEVSLLIRHRDAFAGRVLELGCGAGRVTGFLIEIGTEVHGIDISPAMVERCRRRYPAGSFAVGDMRDLSRFADGSLDAVFAGYNLIDVLPDAGRRQLLDELRRVLAPDGLLVFSTHNRGHAPFVRGPLSVRGKGVLRTVANVVRLPRRLRNRLRLRRLERNEPGYAVVNDPAHDYSILHYYITRDDQQRQLAEQGFALLECRDLDGVPLAPGELREHCPELHYVARREP